MTISKQNIFVAVLLATIALIIGVSLFVTPDTAKGSAPAGTNASVATSSTLQVGPGNNTFSGLGTTSTATAGLEQRYTCAARIISTTAQPIMISFAAMSSSTLSQTVGHQQAASTTVVYDGGLYGCGYMTIRGLNASTTITLTETR